METDVPCKGENELIPNTTLSLPKQLFNIVAVSLVVDSKVTRQ